MLLGVHNLDLEGDTAMSNDATLEKDSGTARDENCFLLSQKFCRLERFYVTGRCESESGRESSLQGTNVAEPVADDKVRYKCAQMLDCRKSYVSKI